MRMPEASPPTPTQEFLAKDLCLDSSRSGMVILTQASPALTKICSDRNSHVFRNTEMLGCNEEQMSGWRKQYFWQTVVLLE